MWPTPFLSACLEDKLVPIKWGDLDCSLWQFHLVPGLIQVNISLHFTSNCLYVSLDFFFLPLINYFYSGFHFTALYFPLPFFLLVFPFLLSFFFFFLLQSQKHLSVSHRDKNHVTVWPLRSWKQGIFLWIFLLFRLFCQGNEKRLPGPLSQTC